MAIKKLNFKEEIDFTTGSLFKKIILFVIPVMLTSLFQLLYSSADLFVVAHFGGGNYEMAAIGDNGSLINLIVNTFVCVSVGANVVMALLKGRKDAESASKAMHSSIILAFVLGVVVAIIGYFTAPYILAAMNTPTEGNIRGMATSYLQIYFLGVPFLMVFNFGAAILRALGDSRRPLIALGSCGLVNIGLNFLFVMVFHLGVQGVAATTVIAEILESIMIIGFLMNNKGGFVEFSFKKLRLDKKETMAVLRNGIPSGAETLIFSISNVIIQSQANLYSASIVSGNTASDNIEGYVWVVIEAFAVSVSSIVAQNYGGLNKDNLKKALRYSCWLIIGLGFLFGGIAIIFRYDLIKIMIVESSDPTFDYQTALEYGTLRLLLMGATYWICGLMDCFSGYLRGLGHSIAPTVVVFCCACLFRIIYVYCIYGLIPGCHTFGWLYASYPFSWALAVVIYLVILPHFQKKAEQEIDEEIYKEKQLAQSYGK
jgi:putative MATE family efflux protein